MLYVCTKVAPLLAGRDVEMLRKQAVPRRGTRADG